MPHTRHRHLTTLIQKSLRFLPITGIYGHRQVGKTTLTSALADRYLTLDDFDSVNQALEAPFSFLEKNSAKPLVIDECQLAPPLFPALKEWVRTHPKPGQFLVTGSVRFSSRKAIRESLTGRIIAWELLPMDLSEAHGKPLPDTILRLIRAKTVDIPLKPSGYVHENTCASYLKTGGLPGIFAIRDPALRNQRFETQLNTILERDLKLIFETTLSLRTLKNLLNILALRQTQPLEWALLSRQSRISIPTLRKLIAAFEAMYLVRLIETEGTEKKPALFFEDQGEATHLSAGKTDALTELTQFLYANLRVQLVYRPEAEGSIFQYRTRGGAFIPLCFRLPVGELGVIPTLDGDPSSNALSSAKSFLRAYKNSKVIFAHQGKVDRILESRMRVVGIQQLV